ETGEAILLEDEIGPMIQAGRCGLVTIAGGPGPGKTTGLRHLAAILPPRARGPGRVFDEAEEPAPREAAATECFLVTMARRPSSPLNRHKAEPPAPFEGGGENALAAAARKLLPAGVAEKCRIQVIVQMSEHGPPTAEMPAPVEQGHP